MSLAMNSISWLPLESNPDVMNNFIYNLGVKEEWKFVDIWGFDDELLQYVQKPVYALLLLYPCDICELPPESLEKGDEPVPDSSNVYFMKQMIRNACGAIAIIHAIANNLESIEFQEGSAIKDFIEKTKELNPEERAVMLCSSSVINDTHHECAQDGQTIAPGLDASVDLHFIALVHHGGTLYELDGRKSGPVSHGSTSEKTFLEDAAKVCRKFMSSNPECLRFTAVALTKPSE